MQNANLSTGVRLVGVPTIARGGTDELELFGRYATSPVSAMLQVGAAPMVLKAYGLLPGETVTVNNVYVPTGAMAVYSYKGYPIVLTNELSTALLPITGNYRLVFSGAQLGNVLVTATTLSGRAEDIDGASLLSQLARPNLYFGPGIVGATSQKVQITSKPWAFRAYGLGSATITVLNVTQADGVEIDEVYAREGAVVELTDSNTTLVLEIAGTYRFEIAGDPTGVLLVGNENPIVFIDPYIPQGPQGVPGPAGGDAAYNVTAGASMTYPVVVAIDGSVAHPADPTNDADMASEIAITTQASILGASVNVNAIWQHTEPAWSWVPGRVYLSLTPGQLTQTPDPSVGAILEVGRVISPTTIAFNVQTAILR
jgi:hypothetical protein